MTSAHQGVHLKLSLPAPYRIYQPLAQLPAIASMPSKRRHRKAILWSKSNGGRPYSLELRNKPSPCTNDINIPLPLCAMLTNPEDGYHSKEIHAEPSYDLLKTDVGIQLAPEICLRVVEEVIKSNPQAIVGLMGLSKVCKPLYALVSPKTPLILELAGLLLSAPPAPKIYLQDSLSKFRSPQIQPARTRITSL